MNLYKKTDLIESLLRPFEKSLNEAMGILGKEIDFERLIKRSDNTKKDFTPKKDSLISRDEKRGSNLSSSLPVYKQHKKTEHIMNDRKYSTGYELSPDQIITSVKQGLSDNNYKIRTSKNLDIARNMKHKKVTEESKTSLGSQEIIEVKRSIKNEVPLKQVPDLEMQKGEVKSNDFYNGNYTRNNDFEKNTINGDSTSEKKQPIENIVEADILKKTVQGFDKDDFANELNEAFDEEVKDSITNDFPVVDRKDSNKKERSEITKSGTFKNRRRIDNKRPLTKFSDYLNTSMHGSGFKKEKYSTHSLENEVITELENVHNSNLKIDCGLVPIRNSESEDKTKTNFLRKTSDNNKVLISGEIESQKNTSEPIIYQAHKVLSHSGKGTMGDEKSTEKYISGKKDSTSEKEESSFEESLVKILKISARRQGLDI